MRSECMIANSVPGAAIVRHDRLLRTSARKRVPTSWARWRHSPVARTSLGSSAGCAVRFVTKFEIGYAAGGIVVTQHSDSARPSHLNPSTQRR